MITPGKQGPHTLAGKRANAEGMHMRGPVSTPGNDAASGELSVLDVRVVSRECKFKADRYTVLQPQGLGDLRPWIAEVTRGEFLNQVGHAIVQSALLVIDAHPAQPVAVTGRHNFQRPRQARTTTRTWSSCAGHPARVRACATRTMSV